MKNKTVKYFLNSKFLDENQVKQDFLVLTLQLLFYQTAGVGYYTVTKTVRQRTLVVMIPYTFLDAIPLKQFIRAGKYFGMVLELKENRNMKKL